jgi:chromosome segregation ATPase
MSTTNSVEAIEADGAIGPRRAPRISRDDVFQAADALLLQGDRPTIDRVRMKLGRGSPNTINDHLDAWWSRLGARLRGVPGQEVPGLPESIALRLQQLWHEALDAARLTLQETLAGRESDLMAREEACAERERAAHERSTALEESLALARQQLTAANARAAGLEGQVTARAAEVERLNEQIERWQQAARDAQTRMEAGIAAHAAERTELLTRSTQAEQHWMLELDRAHQTGRENAQRHEQAVKEWHRKVQSLETEREQQTQQLSTLRANLQTQQAVREHLQSELTALLNRSAPQAKAVVALSRKGTGRATAVKPAAKLTRRKPSRS